MNEFGQQIIFKQLLDRHQRIQIPMIQRDYAQGRPTEKEIREEFINTLQNALLLPLDDESLPMNLDFIYGSVEGKEDTRFLPLDGQQRLTTLFLLHWYLAWKDGAQDDFRKLLCPQGPSRFSYNVRPSSTEFFDQLVNFFPASSPDEVTSLKTLVTDQPWYFRYWRLDPTIQSSLTMLESIHEHFHSAECLFSRLMDEEQPAITFQLLDLENFGLSDDLYIKMNARGKPLTAFETFKARYEQKLGDYFVGETRAIGDQNVPVTEFFARRMDTQWANFFWAHRDKETNLYDEAVMNLFRVIALVTRDPESEFYKDTEISYLQDITLLRNKSEKLSYTIFHSKGWLDRKFSETLIMLLEAWSKGGVDFSIQLPDKRFFDEVKLFTKIVNEPTSLVPTEIIQFVGYIVFIKECSDDFAPALFQEWMRIVFNLSVNTVYDRPADMQRSITALINLAPNARTILDYFETIDKPTAGFNLQQVSEEKLKAELIHADEGWRPLIDQAEGHGYFKGQIEFLLDFCGAREVWLSPEFIGWTYEEHEPLQKQFEYYMERAEIMFNTNGLVNIDEYRWERALLSIGDYLLISGVRNRSFLVNSSTEPASWKRLLRGIGVNTPEPREILHQLLDRLTISSQNGALEKQLDKIINDAVGIGVDHWRQVLVKTPKAIEYCDQRAIRFDPAENVYLLKKSQMNGTHAELFTYCLYQHLLELPDREITLAPLVLYKYESAVGTDSEPYFPLCCEYNECQLVFIIEFLSGSFIVRIKLDPLEDLPNIEDLLDSLGFQFAGDYLSRESSPADIQNDLFELAEALLESFSKE